MNRRALRKFKNGAFLALSLIATLAGLACLAAILWTLLSHGISAMSWHLFTQMTPPPGGQGGLLNALYGSAAMTVLGILVGSPIGVLAGTYLAEYGRNSRLSIADPLHQRCAAERPVDHHRAVHLRDRRGAHGPFLGDRRRLVAWRCSPSPSP